MPPLVAVNSHPRLLRRLVAACAILSVLMTTLGWAHPVCASPAEHGAAAGHHAPDAPPATDPCHAAQASGGADRPGGPHDAPASAACLAAAHCATAAFVTPATAPVQGLELPARPIALGDALPASPTPPPDPPPPKR